MSSRPFGGPLRIDCGPSRIGVLYLIAVHGGGLLSLVTLPLHGPVPAALIVAVVASFGVSLRRCLRPGVTLLWDAKGRWYWCEAGERREVLLCPGPVVWPALVVLRFREAESGRRRALPVFLDSVAPDTFRRLRARLRYEMPRDRRAFTDVPLVRWLLSRISVRE